MAQVTSVEDFGALWFGRGAEFEVADAERVRDAVRDSGVSDLYLVVHGAHNDEEVGGAVDPAFRSMLGQAWSGSDRRVGFLGVHWPSLCFRDEGLPGVDEAEEAGNEEDGPRLSRATVDDLFRHLPDSGEPLTRIVELLRDRPEHEPAFDDFGTALRRLAEVPLQDPVAGFGSDTEGEVMPQSDPLMLFEDTRTMCAEFGGALRDVRRAREKEAGAPARQESGGSTTVSEVGTLQETRTAGPRPARPVSDRVRRTGTVAGGGPLGQARATDFAEAWAGAHELFRQVVRHVLRRRAGMVGQLGLGTCLPLLAEGSDVRLHVVGHGLGGRLAGFALRGVEEGAATPVLLSSLTLLQGEMSHFAFADSLPQQVSGHGALWNLQRLVQGPLICTFSHLDFHLGVFYPLSAQMIGDSPELATTGRKWGALGFDGIQGVEGTPPVPLKDVAQLTLGSRPHLNVDGSEVIRSERIPMGGHHEVFHPEIGQLLRQAVTFRRDAD